VGLDAIATLLRFEGGKNLFAEDSFFVQIKAASVREVPYKADEMSWLRGLELPLFLGSVALHESAMSLYTCHNVSQALVMGGAKSPGLSHGNPVLAGFRAAQAGG
jgi:hypothetical protein